MWPDDYIDWARRAKILLIKRLRELVENLLPAGLPLRQEADSLASQIAKEVFDLARDHRRDLGYFENESRFVLWLTTVGFREMMRLLLCHEAIQPFLDELLTRQRCILGLIYRDRLFPGDVGPLLGIGPEQVRQVEREALEALLREIGRSVHGADD